MITKQEALDLLQEKVIILEGRVDNAEAKLLIEEINNIMLENEKEN